MQHKGDAANVGRDFAEQFYPLAGDRSLENWKPSEVSLGPRYICDKTTADKIADENEYNWNSVRFPLQNLRNKIGTGYDYIWCQSDQLFGESSRFVGIGTSPTRIY